MDPRAVRAAEAQMRRAAPPPDVPPEEPPAKRARLEGYRDVDDEGAGGDGGGAAAAPALDNLPPALPWLRFDYAHSTVASLTLPGTRGVVVLSNLRRERSAAREAAGLFAAGAGVPVSSIAVIKLGSRGVGLLVVPEEEQEGGREGGLPVGAAAAAVDAALAAVAAGGDRAAHAERLLPVDAVCAVDAMTIQAACRTVAAAWAATARAGQGSGGNYDPAPPPASFAVMYRRFASAADGALPPRDAILKAAATGAAAGLAEGGGDGAPPPRVDLAAPDVALSVARIPLASGGVVAAIGAISGPWVVKAAGKMRVAAVGAPR